MITENDIKLETDALNSAAKKYDKVYLYRKGNDGTWALFSTHDNVYRPVYLAINTAGLFAYISLLKNIYLQGKV